MTHEQIKKQLISIIEARKVRSAWMRGVKDYAIDLLDNIEDMNSTIKADYNTLNKILLNGADSWHDYSWACNALVYNEDIVRRLCPPSEVKRSRCGECRPNRHDEWLDLQARALFWASHVVYESIQQLKWNDTMEEQHDQTRNKK